MVDERHKRGKAGEDAAAEALEILGFTIEDRNVRLGRLEVDLVARDEQGLVVAEVRSREEGDPIDPFESMKGPKERNVENALSMLDRSGQGRAVYIGVTLVNGLPAEIKILDIA